MSMSVGMLSGLSALMTINSQLSDLQTQATTGKKVNTASDNLTAFLNADTYTKRANSISDVNNTLTNNISTINGASTGLTQIRKTITDTLAQLKDASQTQSFVQGTDGKDVLTDSGETNVNLGILTAVNDAGVAVTNFNYNTALVNAGGAGFTLKIGGQALRQGAIYTVSTSTGSQTFRISSSSDATVGSGNGSNKDNAAKVTTFADLMGVLGAAGLTINNRPGAATTNIANLILQTTFASSAGVTFTQNAGSTDGTKTDLAQIFSGARGKPNGSPNNWTADDTSASSGLIASSNQKFTLTGNDHAMTGGVNGRTADIKRANAAKSYNQAMTTINQYLNDATVSGVNLLNGDKIKATFNEKGNSQTFQVADSANNAIVFSAKGLGLVDPTSLGSLDTTAYFANNYDAGDNAGTGVGLMAAIDKLTTALSTIDFGASQISSFQNTVQDRKDFNTGMISLLNTSANNLTAADMTEVSAKSAALQIQQSFAQTILANTKQSDQSIMQLLR